MHIPFPYSSIFWVPGTQYLVCLFKVPDDTVQHSPRQVHKGILQRKSIEIHALRLSQGLLPRNP